MKQSIELLKKYFIFASLLILFIVPVSGCSVFMAAQLPPAKNVELFKTGTLRDELLAEFGQPLISEETNGKKTEMCICPGIQQNGKDWACNLSQCGRCFNARVVGNSWYPN